MDTEAIASEIVYLKNRMAQLDKDSGEEKQRLQDRLRKLQGELSEDTPDAPDAETPADEVRYIPPA